MAEPTSTTVTPGPAAVQLPLPADVQGRLAALQAQARQAHDDFAKSRARTARLVASAAGSPRGSDAWSVASVALADLSSARSQTAIPLADLDELYTAERINAAGGTQTDDGGNGQAIAAVRDQVTAWVADEDAVLAELAGRLGN